MRIVIFGANGPTGRILTKQALDVGHTVVAVTRHPEAFPLVHPEAQGLDGVALEPAGNGQVALASPGLPVVSLLLTYPLQLLLEHVHPALRIVVQEAV